MRVVNATNNGLDWGWRPVSGCQNRMYSSDTALVPFGHVAYLICAVARVKVQQINIIYNKKYNNE